MTQVSYHPPGRSVTRRQRHEVVVLAEHAELTAQSKEVEDAVRTHECHLRLRRGVLQSATSSLGHVSPVEFEVPIKEEKIRIISPGHQDKILTRSLYNRVDRYSADRKAVSPDSTH